MDEKEPKLGKNRSEEKETRMEPFEVATNFEKLIKRNTQCQLAECQEKVEDERGRKIDEEYQKKYFGMVTEERRGWGKNMSDALKIVGLPDTPKMHNILWGIVSVESSKFNPKAKNPKSGAYGLGQAMRENREVMWKELKKMNIPDLPDEPNGEFKEDPRWQLVTLALYAKMNAALLKKYSIDAFSGHPRDMAFLYLAHHDGGGGVTMFIKWWRDKGKPERIPDFPNNKINAKYARKFKNKKHEFQRIRGAEGTNYYIDYAYQAAANAVRYGKRDQEQAEK